MPKNEKDFKAKGKVDNRIKVWPAEGKSQKHKMKWQKLQEYLVHMYPEQRKKQLAN